MTLDVVIPTHNRARLLRLTLESLLAATRPPGLSVTVTVCDNRSTDDTPQVVAEFKPRFAGALQYVYESVQGRSAALNAGIAAGDGDLVAMIDDDEEVDREWFACISRVFADPGVDFIGGPYVPRWTTEPPAWLPSGYGAVFGRADCGPEPRQYGPGFDGMLMGGNAVIRRPVLDRVGRYRTDLGRTATTLMSCEDEDMFKRLLATGARGFYRPDLVIHHHVLPERISKRYFRRWCYWRGISLGILDRNARQPVAYLLGTPRYLIGDAARAIVAFAKAGLDGDPSARFGAELAWWDLAGFVLGRYWNARSARVPATPGGVGGPEPTTGKALPQ